MLKLFIDNFHLQVLSLIIICSPSINVPVVCDNAISFKPVAPPFFAAYPIAPLARPLIFEPYKVAVKGAFKIVNVWISYKCKSQGVVAPE